jgi:apolipoprotein N-acyltransferase
VSQRQVAPAVHSAANPRLSTALLAALATGGLYFAAFPPLDIGPLAFVALVPLLAVCPRQSRRAAFLTGWLAGTIGIYALVTPSIHEAALRYAPDHPWVAWLLALLIPQFYGALYFGIFALLARMLVARGEGPLAELVLLPAVWVAGEVVRSHLGDGCPWVLLGHSQYQRLSLIQVADLGGVPAVSYVVALVNVALAAVGRRERPLAARLASPALAAAVVATVWLYGDWQSRRWAQPAGAALRVSLVQGDVPDEWRYSLRRVPDTVHRLSELTAQAAASRPDLVVWPENAVSVLIGGQESVVAGASAQLPPGTALLLGAPRAVERGSQVELRNAALVFEGGRLTGAYDKLRLTPFGETYPFGLAAWLPPPTGGYSPGSDGALLAVGGHRFAAVICYEAIYADLVRQLVGRGAEFVVNISNDGWFGQQPSLAQHFHAALFRAVENRRFLLRGTNAGITAIVDPRGAVVAEAPREVPVVLDGTVTPIAERTLYGRVGDVFGWGCVAIVALALAWRRRL